MPPFLPTLQFQFSQSSFLVSPTDFWDGKWVVRKTAYYNKTLSEMLVVFENKCSLQERIDKAIVDTILGFVEVAKMDGGDNGAAD